MKFQAKYANGEEFTLTASDIDQATKKASEWQETVGASLQDLQPLSSSLVRPLALLTIEEIKILDEGLSHSYFKSSTIAKDLRRKIDDEVALRRAKK